MALSDNALSCSHSRFGPNTTARLLLVILFTTLLADTYTRTRTRTLLVTGNRRTDKGFNVGRAVYQAVPVIGMWRGIAVMRSSPLAATPPESSSAPPGFHWIQLNTQNTKHHCQFEFIKLCERPTEKNICAMSRQNTHETPWTSTHRKNILNTVHKYRVQKNINMVQKNIKYSA